MKKLSFLQLSVLALLFVWCSLQVVTCEKLSDHEDRSKEHTDHEEKSKEQDDDVIEVRRAPITDSAKLVEQDFVHGFIASISIIIISELGDKTFFIAAIMAMRHSRMTVFLGAILALAVMTVLSALFGWVTTVIPRVYTFYISTALFAFFGLKMLKEGVSMSWDEGSEELEEVQSDLKKKEDEFEQNGPVPVDAESGTLGVNPRIRNRVLSMVSRVFLQAFTMTFLAEWGDRSQLATIILAAREDVAGVTIGAVIGHALCTGLAVLGGRMIAQRISVKTVTLIGGVVFLIFAAASLIIGPDS